MTTEQPAKPAACGIDGEHFAKVAELNQHMHDAHGWPLVDLDLEHLTGTPIDGGGL